MAKHGLHLIAQIVIKIAIGSGNCECLIGYVS